MKKLFQKAGIIGLLFITVPTLAASLAEDLWTNTAQDSACSGTYDINQLKQTLFQQDQPSTIRARADRLELSLDGLSRLEGNVSIAYQGVELYTPEIDLDLNNYVFQSMQGMTVVNNDFALAVLETEISMTSQELNVQGADFVIFDEDFRGRAEAVYATTDEIQFYDVSITHCPPKNNSWLVSAREIRLNRVDSIAVARDVTLNVGKLPALYIPYLRFPVGTSRISGFLPPQVESSSLRGYAMSVPLYFNLAPNYDLTVTPLFSSSGNHSIAGEFRFLSRMSSTQIEGNFLPSDSAYRDFLQSRIDRGSDADIESDRRWYVGAKHTMASSRWTANVDYSFVSDENYLRDFGDSIDDLGRVGLSRTARLEYWGSVQEFFVTTQRYEPFSHWGTSVSKTPEIGYNCRLTWQGTQFGLASHTAHFRTYDIDSSQDSTRTHLDLSWKVPFEREWGHASLLSSRSMTRFDFNDRHEVRLLTSFLFDSGITFERSVGKDKRYFQKLQPKFVASKRTMNHVAPYPIFDNGEHTRSFETIFYPTRILGYDKLEEIESIALGVRHTLTDLNFYRDLLSVQFVLGSHRTVSANESTQDQLYGLAIQGRPSTVLQLSLAVLQFSEQDDNWTHEFRIKFEQADWRFTSWMRTESASDLKQSYMDFAVPVHDRWKAYGRLHIDWSEQEHIESFIGVEYAGCCIEYRILWYETLRYEWVNSESLQTGRGIRFEISLKGLTSLGDNVRSMVRRGARTPFSIYTY